MNLINKAIQNAMLNLTLRGNELILSYQRKTERCSWSIFDAGGAEVSSGILSGGSMHTISVNDLSPNFYQICVIDGAEMANSRFRIT
ncbi:MAG TPA: hypothetical protein VL651_07290 [Bacteroidia bacterium]|nr:hypothetical protein [Bacteroidia bacterium]